MLDQQASREREARLFSDGFNHFGALFGKEKKERENIAGLWPHSPSLTESLALKVVAHGRMQGFGGECFDRRIGLFMRRTFGEFEGQSNNNRLSKTLFKVLHENAS